MLWSSARKVSCRAFWRLMMKVLAAPDELVALEQAGWRTVNVDNLRIDGANLHQLWAVKGERRIVYVRPGSDARVDQFGQKRVLPPGAGARLLPLVGRAGQGLGLHRRVRAAHPRHRVRR